LLCFEELLLLDDELHVDGYELDFEEESLYSEEEYEESEE
jgi:hypothetical protein